jgi:hypothetical protein
MGTLSDDSKAKLMAAGRSDLIDIMEINDSGYAGILPTGCIVDRKLFPEALSISANSMFNLPEPKKLKSLDDILMDMA